MTHRKNPIYLTTFSDRPPKEEAMMAIALNRIYTPILRQQVEVLESDADVAAMVERRWAEYGLADLQLGEVDPNLFGYDMR